MSAYNDERAWEDDPYPELRAALAPEYRDLPPNEVEAVLESAGLSAEEMEFSLKKAFGSVGQFAKAAAPTVLPLAGTVVGTAFGGPAGAAVGGMLGRAAGSAVGGPAGPSRPGRTSCCSRRSGAACPA